MPRLFLPARVATELAVKQGTPSMPTLSRARVANRVLAERTAPDFQHAVKLVTGQDIDLRGAATPGGGWLSPAVPAGGTGWGYAGFGRLFFGVSRNEKACTDWHDAAWVYENIDHEVSSGRFGLMDVQRLRDAEAVTSRQADRLSAMLDEIKRVANKMETGSLAGSAASMIVAKMRELGRDVNVQRNMLVEPAPGVPSVLHCAAEALAELGRQLSYIWWESNQVLLNAPNYEIDAIRYNIDSYLSMNDLGQTADIPLLLASPSDVSDAAQIGKIREVLGRYDSTLAGALPAGMGSIIGDLTQQPVWAAANAAITRRITAELDKLDPVARLQTEKVRAAYEAAAHWMTNLRTSRGRMLDPTPVFAIRDRFAGTTASQVP